MSRKRFSLVIVFCCALVGNSMAQYYDWAKGMGGTLSAQTTAMAMDAAGNIYITGPFQGTVDFDPGTGVSNLTSSGTNNIFIAKYDNLGNYVWAKKIGGPANDVSYAIQVGISGNIYVSGYFSSSTVDFDPGAGVSNLSSTAGSYDIFMAKYDPSGNYIWAKKIGGIGADNAWALRLDDSEHIYIAGYFWTTVDFDPGAGTANLTSEGNYDIYIGKYDSAGTYIWAKRMGGKDDDKAYAIDLETTGAISVCGVYQSTADLDPGSAVFSLTAMGKHDIFMAQYDNSGNFSWAKSIGGAGEEIATRIAIDAAGDHYITGYFENTTDFDPGSGTANRTSNGNNDLFLAKYDNNGNYIWVKSMGSTDQDYGRGIAFDDSSNVYLTGSFSGTVDFNPGSTPVNLTSFGSSDIFITKYTASGIHHWSVHMGGSGADIAIPIQTNHQYNVYIGGGFSAVADFDPDPAQTANLNAPALTAAYIAKYKQCIHADQPAVTATRDAICTGDKDTLRIAAGALHSAQYWQWYTDSCGGTPVDTGEIIIVAPDKDIIYYVQGAGGVCPEPDPCASIPVTVHPLPVITASADDVVCAGETVHFQAASNDQITFWQWYGPGGLLQYIEDWTLPNADPEHSGDYIVFGKDNNGCISQPVTVPVWIQPLPPVRILNNDTLVRYGSTVQLLATGAETYRWEPAASVQFPDANDPVITPTQPGTYVVTGSDSLGCINTDSIFIDIDYNDPLLVPSAFSPNNDGLNDRFKIENLTFQVVRTFKVFNRWGQLIYDATYKNDGWDGTINGKAADAGSYFYLIIIDIPNGTSKTFKGDVALIR